MIAAHRSTSPSIATIALLTVAPLVVGTTACSVIQRLNFKEPTVRLERVTVTGLGLSGGSLRLHLDVHNPNPYDLQGTQFSADVDLEGTRFGRISRESAIFLPADTHSPVDIDLEFTWAGVGAAARGLISRGAVDYELTGRILVDTPIDDRWVEIGTTGTATLEDLR